MTGHLRSKAGAVVFGVSIVGMLLTSGSAQAAIYVRFEGIDGGSLDRDHRNWCDAVTFSHGLNHPASATGSTRRRGSVEYGALSITRRIDKASPKLEEAAARGNTIPRVTLHVTASSADAGRVPYYQVVLTNVVITSYTVQGSSESPPTEEVGLSFEQISVTFTEVDHTGGRGGSVTYEYNVAAGGR
jgi:type VI secretion system secreted protein Hcp